MKKSMLFLALISLGIGLFAAQPTAPQPEVTTPPAEPEDVNLTIEDERASLPNENTDLKKARKSMMEELDAVSLYETRIEGANNPELKKVLEHNKNEEKEHIAMLMDWLRKNDAQQDAAFKKSATDH